MMQLVTDHGSTLGVAATCSASLIVSGDHHLLDLGEYEGIRIMTPREFLELLGR